MKMKYSYRIRKRKAGESINGYGYEAIVYYKGEQVISSGAFGSEGVATDFVNRYIRERIMLQDIAEKISK